MNFRLYSYWRSSSAWRVRIALAFKHVDCEIVPVDILRDGGQQRRPEFLAKNPAGQVPVLEVDKPGTGVVFRLTQSLAILEYLEQLFPEPPLLPPDAEARARVRQFAEIVNSGIQPLQNLKFVQELSAHGVDPQPLVKRFIERGLRTLEDLASVSSGRFLVGEDVTLADVALVPQLYASRRYGVDVEDFPTLRRVEAECAALPAFKAAHADAQPDRPPPPADTGK